VKTLQLILTGLLVVAGNLWAAGDKRELLSKHETVAEFTGLRYQQCRGLTTMCPDKCGSSGNFAHFRIIKYLAYEKPGQYGDPKGEEFVTQVDDNMGRVKLPAAQAELFKTLKPGDFVKLSWRHDYVTNANGSSPERPLTKVEKVTEDEAKKLAGDAPLHVPADKKKGPAVQPMAF
jgi:hypothetical protein